MKKKQFQVGKTYRMNSICDSDCWWYYKVESRTKSTVTLRQLHADGSPYNEEKTFRISKGLSELFGCESVKPLGRYSMSPTLTAEKDYKIEKPKVVDTEKHQMYVMIDGVIYNKERLN